jgi:hypothetical protein
MEDKQDNYLQYYYFFLWPEGPITKNESQLGG